VKTVTVKEEPEEVVGISQSEFVINLDDNEEVIWIADSVSRDDDVAYVTEEKTLENIPLFIPGWHLITHTITARNWWGRHLFSASAKALCRMDYLEICLYIIDLSHRKTTCLRYYAEGWRSVTLGIGFSKPEVFVDSYWSDQLTRQEPHIYVRAVYPGTHSGYLEWDS